MRITHPGVAVACVGVLALGVLPTLGRGVRLQATGPSPERAQTIVVSTSAELEAALSPSNAGQYITVRAGTYELAHALVVPDGATVAGEGVMTFDESGWPEGFEGMGRTVLRSRAELVGDVITLGNGATVRGLVVEDSPGRLGNAVVVASRAPGDVVSAAVIDCEIINPNRSGRLPRGPIGRGLVVVTRNPNLNLDPPPHDGASLFVEVRSSIVRAPEGGSGVFAANFAPQSQIALVLTGNIIGGGLDASGGIGRPDAVFASSVFVESKRNFYRSDTVAPTPVGWILTGGADAPLPGLISEGARLSALTVHSIADRIDGFDRGVEAAGGRKFSAVSASSSQNHVELELHGTEIVSVRADLQVFGARTLAEAVTPGDGNVLRMLMRHVKGSGQRDNEYAHSWSPSMATRGVGNRLEVIGGVTAFAMTNDDILPSPPTGFFTADTVAATENEGEDGWGAVKWRQGSRAGSLRNQFHRR